tara:strand:+ start:210 stop:410 length:201 start_codon:yes stop_codon:yes gene_type:complete
MDVLTDDANILLDLLLVKLVNWIITIIATATIFTFDNIRATKKHNWHILYISLTEVIESISHVSLL